MGHALIRIVHHKFFHSLSPSTFIILFAMAAMLSIPALPAHAQPQLKLNRVHEIWPAVELYFTVTCADTVTYGFSLQDFQLTDNGRDVMSSATLTCPPDPNATCAISVALVFDASGSMSGAGNAAAKLGGHAFIDRMDGVADEASVIWFTQAVTLFQSMTTIKPMLDAAVDAIPASGATAMWDGCYAGIVELTNNGINQCRAVIVLSDGLDNSSTHTPVEIVSLAQQNGIRIYTIALGTSTDDSNLTAIASQTGGAFYKCNSSTEVVSAYVGIHKLMQNLFEECMISYTASCPDGLEHTARLSIDNFCGGSASDESTYTAPLDTNLVKHIRMEFSDVTVDEDLGTVTVPLDLATPYDSVVFRRLAFNMRYDTTFLKFNHAAVASGGLLSGVSLSVTPFASSVNIQTMSDRKVPGMGALMEMTFDVKDVYDTTCTLVWGRNAVFEATCNVPVIDSGEVCINSGIPIANCAMEWPRNFVWDSNVIDYLPNPFDVKMKVFNTGDSSARNVRYKIEVDDSVILLVSPQNDIQSGSPPDIPPNSNQEVRWLLFARPQVSAIDTRIRIVASFDNHKDIDCAIVLHIPQAQPALSCYISMPSITVDPVLKQYVPLPMPITLLVNNAGGITSDSLFATLMLPPEMELAVPDAPGSFRKTLMPAVLPAGQDATIRWMADVKRIERYALTIPVTVMLTSNSGDTLYCNSDLDLPGSNVPHFNTTLQALGNLDICEGDSVMLDAGPGFASYLWSSGEKTRILAAKKLLYYFCTVWDSTGRMGFSDTVAVLVHPLPNPSLITIGSNPLCEGDTVQLYAGGSYVNHRWSTGATSKILRVTEAGDYFVEVTDSYGCVGFSKTLRITMTQPPPVPVVSRTGDILWTTSGYSSYQWYRDGELMPQAIGDSLLLTQPGVYTLIVKGANGCTTVSAPFEVTVVSVRNLPPGVNGFSLFPNPSSGALTIALTLAQPGAIRITVSDLLGRTVREVDSWNTRSASLHDIDLAGAAPGLYMVRVTAKGYNAMRTVVLQQQ